MCFNALYTITQLLNVNVVDLYGSAKINVKVVGYVGEPGYLVERGQRFYVSIYIETYHSSERDNTKNKVETLTPTRDDLIIFTGPE